MKPEDASGGETGGRYEAAFTNNPRRHAGNTFLRTKDRWGTAL